MRIVKDLFQKMNNLYQLVRVNAKLTKARKTHEILFSEEETLPTSYMHLTQFSYEGRLNEISSLSRKACELKSQLEIQNAN